MGLIEYHSKGKRTDREKSSNAAMDILLENPWLPLFKSLDKFSDDFMAAREQPKQQTRDDFTFVK